MMCSYLLIEIYIEAITNTLIKNHHRQSKLNTSASLSGCFFALLCPRVKRQFLVLAVGAVIKMLAKMACALFSLISAMSKNKQAREPVHKLQNCIFDAYIHCWKNAGLFLSLLLS